MGKVYLGNQEISPTVSVPVAKSKFGATIDTFIGNVDENGVLGQAVGSTSLLFDGVKNIDSGACRYVFCGRKNIIGAAFPVLTTISGDQACQYMFGGCTNLTSISLPALTTISGDNACDNMFSSCSITSISFPALTTVSGNGACQRMFYNCSKLISISFPALTTVAAAAFGSSSNRYIFYSCNALTEIHFRADAQAAIEAMAGYADKWGAKNSTIYFDL